MICRSLLFKPYNYGEDTDYKYYTEKIKEYAYLMNKLLKDIRLTYYEHENAFILNVKFQEEHKRVALAVFKTLNKYIDKSNDVYIARLGLFYAKKEECFSDV